MPPIIHDIATIVGYWFLGSMCVFAGWIAVVGAIKAGQEKFGTPARPLRSELRMVPGEGKLEGPTSPPRTTGPSSGTISTLHSRARW